MATTLATLVLKLTGDSGQLIGELSKAEKRAQGFGGRMGGIMGTMAKATVAATAASGVALAGVGIAAVKMASDFESSFAEVKTLLPDLASDELNQLRSDILDVSREFGIAAGEAVPALYQAISAGVPPDNVLEFMGVAAKASIGGVTELETAVDGITSVVNAYGSDVIDAQKASDLMFTAVRLGKTDFDQLSRTLSNVTPIAAALGIGFEDVAANLAVMTAQGTKTSVATAGLRQLFVEMSKSGTKLNTVIQEVTGQSFDELIASGSTTSEILQAVKVAMDASGQSFNDQFSSVEAMGAALQLTGENASAVDAALNDMQNSAGATDAAFATVSDTVSFKFNKAINSIKVDLIEFGSAALPLVAQGIELFSQGVQNAKPFISDFATLVGDEIVPRVMQLAETVRDDVLPPLKEFAENVMGALAVTLAQDIQPKLEVIVPLMVEFGEAALGVAKAIVNELKPVIEGAVSWLSDHKEVVVAIGAAFLTYKVVTIGTTAAIKAYQIVTKAATIATIAMNVAMGLSPLTAIALGLAAIVAVAILVVKNWDDITAALGRFASFVKEKVLGFLQNIQDHWREIALFLGPAGILMIGLVEFKDEFIAIFNKIEEVVGRVLNGALALLGLILGKFDPIIDAIGRLLQAFQDLGGPIADAISKLKDLGSLVEGGLSGVGGFLGFAGGGVIKAGQAALVGEHGPELIMPRGGAQVKTAQQTRSMLGGSGGDTYVINLPPGTVVLGDDRAVEDMFVRGLNAARRSGRFKTARIAT